jgi:hypothetical protein
MKMRKIDLSNATFIVPIRLESSDRLRNVITSLCYILANFKTNVIVHEVDSESVFAESALPQITEFLDGDVSDLKHIFEQSDSPSFHRQRVLNDMILMSTTKVVVNYDCDVLLPRETYQHAYEIINNDHADVIYPYGDGNWQYQVFADDELVTEFLTNDFDMKILNKKTKVYMSKYGFCQFFNRDIYIEGGLENENFVAYAPEDVERYHRFTTLGYRVGRVPDWVYHLEHARTPNSWVNNPHMQENNAEWEKIQKMQPDELREYIDSQEYYQKRLCQTQQ